MQNHADERPVSGDQQAIERIFVFGKNPPAHEPAHQHRHQGDGQAGGGGHRVGLGVGQRSKQAAFLRFQAEHRQKAEGNDQQRKKQRWPNFRRCLLHDSPTVGGVARLGAFEVLVQILDHDDGGVHHRADGDGDTPQRQDVGVDPLPAHDGERGQNADRQTDQNHQRRAQVEQEQRADDDDHDEFLDQLVAQIGDRPQDQAGAVVGRHDFDPFR